MGAELCCYAQSQKAMKTQQHICDVFTHHDGEGYANILVLPGDDRRSDAGVERNRRSLTRRCRARRQRYRGRSGSPISRLSIIGLSRTAERSGMASCLTGKVKPKPAETHNALTYEFDKLQADSAVVELEWEKVAVPFKVSVDVHALTQASLKKQLRNLSVHSWNGWDDAANYLLAEKIDLDEALTYANKSIENEDRYDNEMTKEKVLSALNPMDEAGAAEKKALSLASPLQLHA
jgi:hypothetical protein